MTRWAARAVLSMVRLQMRKLCTCLMPSTPRKVDLTTLWLIPEGVASINTSRVFLRMLTMVANMMLNTNVQMGSMMAYSSLKKIKRVAVNTPDIQ